jgi:hypothetical protein
VTTPAGGAAHGLARDTYFGDGRTPGHTHVPSEYMKATMATTTSAQASNVESNIDSLTQSIDAQA